MTPGYGVTCLHVTTSTFGRMASIYRPGWRKNAECILVIIGATPEGKKELIGFQVGLRESAQSWHELLADIKGRGLSMAPEIAVGDGAMGFWNALDRVFPSTKHQRCWVHKLKNVLNCFQSRWHRL